MISIKASKKTAEHIANYWAKNDKGVTPAINSMEDLAEWLHMALSDMAGLTEEESEAMTVVYQRVGQTFIVSGGRYVIDAVNMWPVLDEEENDENI